MKTSDLPQVECGICGRDGEPPAQCEICHGGAGVRKRAHYLSDHVQDERSRYENLEPQDSPLVVGGLVRSNR